MIVKNLKRYFSFEVQILDDKGIKRRFRASNFQSNTRVKPFISTMPRKSIYLNSLKRFCSVRLDEGWNQVQFNLADFVRRAYGTLYVETLRIQVNKCWLKFFKSLFVKDSRQLSTATGVFCRSAVHGRRVAGRIQTLLAYQKQPGDGRWRCPNDYYIIV